jgi:hypothetical protein
MTEIAPFVQIDDRWLQPNDPKSGITVQFRAEYFAYNDAIARCFRSSCPSFPDYGGRGITMCARWRLGEGGMTGFQCFMADMGARPRPDLSLDRANNDGNYDLGNCRWATMTQQRQNQRPRTDKGRPRVRGVTIAGVKLGVAEWCRRNGIKESTARYRIRKGWTYEQAVTAKPSAIAN